MTDKSNTLNIQPKQGVSHDAAIAQAALSPYASNAFAATLFAKGIFGELSLTDAVCDIQDKAHAIHKGDMSEAEAMLTAQAITLNAIFTEMTRRAALNMKDYLPAMETYMRRALKAQSQCRTTLETLAEIKHPRPVAFVKQANIGYNQQVNNGASNDYAHAHAKETQNPPNELLCNDTAPAMPHTLQEESYATMDR